MKDLFSQVWVMAGCCNDWVYTGLEHCLDYTMQSRAVVSGDKWSGFRVQSFMFDCSELPKYSELEHAQALALFVGHLPRPNFKRRRVKERIGSSLRWKKPEVFSLSMQGAICTP